MSLPPSQLAHQLRSLLPLAFIVAVVLGGVELLRAWGSRGDAQALRELARPGDIRMLSSTTCVYCTRARDWMSEERVPFSECLIERDAACAAEFRARGGQGTPTLIVRGQTIVGFDRKRMLAALTPRS